MKNEINVRVITQDDLVKSGCLNVSNAINVAEDALVKYYNKKVLFPEKVAVVFDEKTQDRINCLPAAILDEQVYGMKWVSVFPQNPKSGLQNVSAVILLSELKHGFPIAFMEGTLCSNLRTAAVSAVACRYLARDNAETIGFIGTGEQAKTHFLSIVNVRKNIKKCMISSISDETNQRFIDQMSKLYPNIEYVNCSNNYEKAVVEADIIVTAISGQEPVLKASWIKKGALYCHVGGYEDEYDVALSSNKIVCDDWNVVKHRTQTISRMYKDGILKDSDIHANLYEIVNNVKVGRENDDEFIYFNAVGLSYVDINLAIDMYKKVSNKNLGEIVKLQNKSMFDYDRNSFIL